MFSSLLAKGNSSKRMRLFSILGRFLFVWFILFSAGQTLIENHTDVRVTKYFATKLDFLENCFGVTQSTKFIIVDSLVVFFMLLKIIGGLLFLFGSLIGACTLIFILLAATPIMYDFYHYKVEELEFIVQNMSCIGALLLFIHMKVRISRRQQKRKASKSKRT